MSRALLARAAKSLRGRGLTVEIVLRNGDPRSVIVDEAKDWGADLIIVGSRGYSGIKRMLLGSVAQSVVNNAPCSVEVVRKKAARKAERVGRSGSIEAREKAKRKKTQKKKRPR